MIPKLSLDDHQASTSRLVPDDPATLNQWIETNVVGPLPERMEILRDSLLSLQQSKLDPNRYLACLKVYRSVIISISAEVRDHNYGLSLPIPADGIALVNGLSEVYGQLANGYKAIVLDEADNPSPTLTLSKLATCCYSALHYVSRVMHIAYEGYQPYPTGLWFEIHQIYLFASSEEIHHAQVRCLSSENDAVDTIEEVYKRALLLNLADPYQLPFRAVDKVHEWLMKWGDMATIQSEPSDPKQRCMFLIDLEFDKPGIPFLSRTRLTGDGQFYILNTASLVSAMNRLIDQILVEKSDDWQDPKRARDGLETVELLRTLILKWGVQPMRSRDRVSTRKACDVVSGINYVSLMVNDQVPYIADDETEQMNTMLREASTDGVKADSLPVQPIDQPNAQSWVVVDESVAGMQLALEQADSVHIAVGELIGIRVKGSDELGWLVGVVRWAKNQTDGEARIGVLKLGWPAMPTMVRSDATGSDAKSTNALLLPGNQELGRKQTLVTPKGMFSPGSMLTIENNDRDVLAKATTLIISTRAGDCFEFEIV